MGTYLRACHQGVTDALAVVAAETHLIEQTRLISVDTGGKIGRMKIAQAASQRSFQQLLPFLFPSYMLAHHIAFTKFITLIRHRAFRLAHRIV